MRRFLFGRTCTQQSFVNDKDEPIYVSIEPWPECFELEKGDRLTLIWEGPSSGDAAEIHFVNERELVVWLDGKIGDVQILFNEGSAEGRSWKFKHD